jgi:hypothetical protein
LGWAAVVPNLDPKVKPFGARVLVVGVGPVVVDVPGFLLVRKTITQSKAEWLRASLVNLSAMIVLKVTARRS